MSPNPRLVPFLRLAAVAAFVGAAAAWAHPRRADAADVAARRAQITRGGAYTLTVYQQPTP